MSGRQPVTAQCAVLMADKLREKCRSYDDLVAISHLKKPTVARWIKALRVPEVRVVFIEGWQPDKNGRLFVPLFRWGTQPDAARPGRALTSAERMRALRATRKNAA